MKNFAILGAGGIAYYLADSLARYLAFSEKYAGTTLFIVDGDIVEDRNLDRQHGIQSLGRNKAEVLSEQLLNTLGDRLNVVPVTEYLLPKNRTSPAHRSWLQDDATVFACVDNDRTRTFTEAALCEFDSTVLVMGGNDLYRGQAQIYIREGGEDRTPKITEIAPEIMNDDDDFPDEESCTEEAEREPQLLFTNQMVAVSMLSLWYSQIEQKSDERLNEVLVNIKTASAHQFNRPSLVATTS